MTKKPDGTLVAAIWNYAEPGQSGNMKTVRLRLSDGRKGRYSVQTVGPGRGSVLEEWVRMGKPAFPTREQIARLLVSSQLPPATAYAIPDPIRLAPHELALVTLKPSKRITSELFWNSPVRNVLTDSMRVVR